MVSNVSEWDFVTSVAFSESCKDEDGNIFRQHVQEVVSPLGFDLSLPPER